MAIKIAKNFNFPGSSDTFQVNAVTSENGVFYVEGSGTTDTTNKVATWLGTCPAITSYYPGLVIAYKISTAGSTTTTLNINDLGAVTVVKNVTTGISTSYAVNSIVLLIYTVDSSGTAYWKTADYDADTKAGSSNSTKKLFLIGATTQSTSGQTTYSNSKCYVNTSSQLVSNNNVVITTAGTGLSKSGETLNHADSITAGTASGTSTSTLSYGGTFTIPTITYNDTGHITAKGTTTLTLPPKVTASELGLSAAMSFRGTTTTAISNDATTNPIKINSADFTAKSGDVVLYGNKEFVFDGSKWKELGDQGSHALKTITISAGSGLTGGGDLSANRTISHADTSTQASITASGRKYITGVTLDTYGHVTGLTTGTETVVDTNYYHTPTATSGIKIGTGTGVSDLYVPTGTSSTTVALGNHSHSSYVNQNAFSNIKVGTTTVAADTTTDTLELAGSNVTLTPDATNDKVTIGITKSNVTTALGYTPPTSTDVTNSINTALDTFGGSLGSLAWENTVPSHAHGNITNSGTITSTAVTAATGVLVYDSNNKIQRATAANARAIIGAGTSDLTIGTTSTTAAAGNHTHSTYVPTSRTVNGKALSGNISLTASDVGAATTAQGTKADNALPKSGGNISGHIYLTGANASSSTGNTSQIVFGTADNNHVAISSSNNTLVINPDISTTTHQIVLYLDKSSVFPCGISSGTAIYEGGTALSDKYAPKYQYSTTDPGVNSTLATGTLYFVYE